jgi:hypothetical protein
VHERKPDEHSQSHASSEPAESGEAQTRQYHADPAEPAAPHEPTPIAHFEPQPKPEGGSGSNKPYVVWSSAPQKSSEGRGPED